MHFTSFLENGRLTIALTGEIDHHCAKEYLRKIGEKLDAYLPRVCVLDYQDVMFMDSSGVAIVIHTLRRMEQLEGKLLLQGLREQPLKVLRTAGLEKIVEIREAIS